MAKWDSYDPITTAAADDTLLIRHVSATPPAGGQVKQIAISDLLAGAGGGGSGTVDSVNGVTPDGGGNVTLTAADVGAASSSALTAEVTRAETAEALLAPKASPAFTGNPTAPTQTSGDSSTKLATTAFVAGAVSGGGGGGGTVPGTVIPISGDSTGATDRAAINAVIASGGVALLLPTGITDDSGTPYYIDQPLTPSTGSALIGIMPWSAVDQDSYGAGNGHSGGSVIHPVSGFSGAAAVSMVNATSTQVYGISLENFTLECWDLPDGSGIHGILMDGAVGAGFMSGVCVNEPDGDCLHIQTDGDFNPDDWHVFRCKFSGSRSGYGVWTDNFPDSWFTDVESSENHLDNWNLSFSANTSLTRCKGENSAAGAGFHLGGQGGNGRSMNLTACTAHDNATDGFLFDTNPGGATGGVYQLANCTAIDDDSFSGGGTPFAGFRSAGCPNVITAVGCYAYGAFYGASQTGTNGGMTFTASSLSGTSAATHDDNGGTHRLINNAPVGTALSGGLSNPMTTLGDVISGGTSGAPARVAGNTTTTRKFFRQTGTGSASAAPAWDTLLAADVPTLNQSTTGNAATATNLAGAATFPAQVAPKASSLTFGTTISVNAALANAFNLTLTASTGTIANPTNPVDGQVIRFRISQDGTGSRTVSWGTAYDFGTGTAPTLSTGANKVDICGFEYVASISKWCALGSGLGF